MAFQRREDWTEKRTPAWSLCRQFEVWCGACGSYRIKAAVEYEDGDFAAMLICQQCRVIAEIKMRAPLPKPFLSRCFCNSIFVCPQSDAEAGTLSFVCLDCLKGENVPVT